jgi:hypothetical protein
VSGVRWQHAVANVGMFGAQDRLVRVLTFMGQHGSELITVDDKASNWCQGMKKDIMLFKRAVHMAPSQTSRVRCGRQHDAHDRPPGLDQRLRLPRRTSLVCPTPAPQGRCTSRGWPADQKWRARQGRAMGGSPATCDRERRASGCSVSTADRPILGLARQDRAG